MTKRSDRESKKARLSPFATVAPVSDDFMAALKVPALPDTVPQRLSGALIRRIQALLFHLREAKRINYERKLEIRLVREAYRAVLAAYELNIPDADVHYACFRQLVEELGYHRVEVGFAKPE